MGMNKKIIVFAFAIVLISAVFLQPYARTIGGQGFEELGMIKEKPEPKPITAAIECDNILNCLALINVKLVNDIFKRPVGIAGRPQFIWPLKPDTPKIITSCFGLRPLKSSPCTAGVDIHGEKRKTQVLAVLDGTVYEVEKNCLNRERRCGHGWGNYVIIKHSDNLFTGYGHLHTVYKKIKHGAAVKQGEAIGLVGATGAVTGPHLDLTVYTSEQDVENRLTWRTGRNPFCYFPKSIRDSLKFSQKALSCQTSSGYFGIEDECRNYPDLPASLLCVKEKVAVAKR